jgi:hypothetical protein
VLAAQLESLLFTVGEMFSDDPRKISSGSSNCRDAIMGKRARLANRCFQIIEWKSPCLFTL